MQTVYKVVDANGDTVKGTSAKSRRLYLREQDAKGAATQFNQIMVIKDGQGVQLEGAPFRAAVAGKVEW